LGGVLLSQFSWSSVFFINVPVVAVSLIVGWWVIPESKDPDHAQFDPVGVVLSILGVATLVWAAIQAPTYGWGSPETLVAFGVGAMLVAAFIIWETRCAHPMLEMTFFKDLGFSVANLASASMAFAFAGSIFVLTQYLQFVLGYTPLETGLALTPLAAAVTVVGLAGPRVAERYRTRLGVAVGLTMFAAGLLVFASATVGSSIATFILGSIAVGIGCGLVLAPSTDVVMGSVPREKAGVAARSLSTTRSSASALGVAVVGSLLVSGYRSKLGPAADRLRLGEHETAAARESIGGALGVADRVGGAVAGTLGDAARIAFMSGMRIAMIASAFTLLAGAALAARFLPGRPVETTEEEQVLIVLGLDTLTE